MELEGSMHALVDACNLGVEAEGLDFLLSVDVPQVRGHRQLCALECVWGATLPPVGLGRRQLP